MKTIVSLSGGVDSAVVLGACVLDRYKPEDVLCVGFRYGSKHNLLEIQAADKIAFHYKVRYRIVDLTKAFEGFHSALFGTTPIPEGHYEEESMRSTVVPCRNMIFSSVLAGIAESEKATRVYLGVHAGDHFIYADCRPRFLSYMDVAIRMATENNVSLITPFMHANKTEIVKIGLKADVPFHLCRTCYTDNEIACGRCGSCTERREAFELNKAEDPIEYISYQPIPKKGV